MISSLDHVMYEQTVVYLKTNLLDACKDYLGLQYNAVLGDGVIRRAQRMFIDAGIPSSQTLPITQSYIRELAIEAYVRANSPPTE